MTSCASCSSSKVARLGAMKSGSVTSPNQLTLKARAEDMSQPSSGVTKSSAYSTKCET